MAMASRDVSAAFRISSSASCSRRHGEHWSLAAPVAYALLRKYPSIVLFPLLLLAVCISLGTWAVVKAADSQVSHRRDLMANLAAALAADWSEAVQPAFTLAVGVGAMVTNANSSAATGSAQLAAVGGGLVGQMNQTGLVQGLVTVPSGHCRAMYGDSPSAASLLDTDMLAEPIRSFTLSVIGRTNMRSVLSGLTRIPTSASAAGLPHVLAAYVSLAVRGPPSKAELAEMYGSSLRCPLDVCYDAAQDVRWWGLVVVPVDMAVVAAKLQHRAHAARGYFTITSPPDFLTPGSPFVVAASQPTASVDASSVARPIGVASDGWTLYVAPAAGWGVPWKVPAIVAVVVGSLLLAACMTAVAFYRAHYNSLLESLLPKEALKRVLTDAKRQGLVKLGVSVPGTTADLILRMMRTLLHCPVDGIEATDVIAVQSVLHSSADIYTPMWHESRTIRDLDDDVIKTLRMTLGTHLSPPSLVESDRNTATSATGARPARVSASMTASEAADFDSLEAALHFITCHTFAIDNDLLHDGDDGASICHSEPNLMLSRVTTSGLLSRSSIASVGGRARRLTTDSCTSVVLPVGSPRVSPQHLRPFSFPSFSSSATPPAAATMTGGGSARYTADSCISMLPLVSPRASPAHLRPLARPLAPTAAAASIATAAGAATACGATSAVVGAGTAPIVLGSGRRWSGRMSASGLASVDDTCCQVQRPIYIPLLETVLSSAESFSFSAFDLHDASHGHPLSSLAFYCMSTAGLIQRLSIKPSVLCRWLLRIEAGYDSVNPYHNATHAADVLQTYHALLTRGGLAPGYVSNDIWHLACYMAAIIHDVGHVGCTNDFLINTGHELALMFNDRAPLENMHVCNAWAVLTQPENNFLGHMAKAEVTQLRRTIIELVLATDMKQHFSILGQFNAMHGVGPDVMASNMARLVTAAPEPAQTTTAFSTATGGDATPTSSGPDQRRVSILSNAASRTASCTSSPASPTARSARITLTVDQTAAAVVVRPSDENEERPAPAVPANDAERLLGLQVALKCADLGHTTADLGVHRRWVSQLEEEFFRQGDEEKARQLPISPLFDRAKQGVSKSQVGFYEVVVLPLYSSLSHVFPAADPLTAGALGNFGYWKAIDLNNRSSMEA